MSLHEGDATLPVGAMGLVEGAVGKAIGMEASSVALGLEMARSRLKRAPQEALKSYACLVLLAPTNIECQVGLANCAVQVEEFAIALQAASAAVALAPRDPRGYYLSGRACMGLEKFSEALEDLADAISFACAHRRADIVEASKSLRQAVLLLQEIGSASAPA